MRRRSRHATLQGRTHSRVTTSSRLSTIFNTAVNAQETVVRLLPKLKLEIAVNEAFVEPAVEAIVQAGRSGDTGKLGDGKIFVLPLEDCIQIRTGETGMIAIGP